MNGDAHAETDGIAIVAMTGRFPGAPTIEAFWQNLRDGVESITRFTPGELEAAGVPREVFSQEGYVPAAGILDGIELFDASSFGFSPRDAEMLDPQQRLMLECAWEVLELAGCNPDEFPGLIGMYAGTSLSLYAQHNLYPRTGIPGGLDDFQVFLSNDKDHLATRVAYKLNLRGPAVTVQTACSTSLVAVCMACDSLQAVQCDLALAGGVTIRVPQIQGYSYAEGGIGSPDGHCRSFDARANGTVGSSGVALVALKRLSDALEDGDHIHAIIRGWAVNNDGSAKVGYTAPSVAGQSEVIASAMALAGVGPESISYVETHGTATALGDPIEIAGLTRAFSRTPLPPHSCAIGSLKSNVGHLDSAAGAAALIKTTLSLEHRLIPPSLHFESPNPAIDFNDGPFFVNDRLREWLPRTAPRRAGVSSFGIGGTNAHVVLEEAPSQIGATTSSSPALFVLSANSASALDALSARLADHLTTHPDVAVADVASTLQIGRRALTHRRAFVCRDVPDAIACLAGRERSRVRDRVVRGPGRALAFLFPGQGAQHVNMGRELYQCSPRFADIANAGAALLRRECELDVLSAIYPADADDGADARLQSTAIAQPALFLIEYALAQTWLRWGIEPTVLFGHSLGEYVAACLAGVFSFEDALRLVAIRGRMMQALPRGAMTAVSLSASDVERLLDEETHIAAVNAPRLVVVSGPFGAIEQLEHRWADAGVATQRLNTSHAFHSAMLEPMLEPFAAEVRRVRLSAPRLPVISNVTGSWLTDAQAIDPWYWARQARAAVRFSDGVRTLRSTAPRTLLEVGPGSTLTRLVRMTPESSGDETLLTSLPVAADARSPREHMTETLGSLWLDGARVNWRSVNASDRRRVVPLPTYPFERQRYWIAPAAAPRREAESASLRRDVADWFSVPTWTRKPPAPPLDERNITSSSWVILADRNGVGDALATRLRQLGARVRIVFDGDGAAQLTSEGTRVHERDFYTALLGEMDSTESPPRVVHLWGLTAPDASPSPERIMLGGFYSLLALAHAAAAWYHDRPIHIDVVTDGVHRVRGDEPICPLKRATLAIAKGIRQEYPALACRFIELDWRAHDAGADRALDALILELHDVSGVSPVALRGVHRWAPSFERVSLPLRAERTRLTDRGVYVITGGLGQIGLTLAHHLASRYHARLALVSRTALPERSAWPSLMAGDGEAIASYVRAIASIEQAGGEVLLVQADMSDPEQVERMLAETRSRFGSLNGVIHGAGLTTPDGFAMLSEADMLLCERQLAGKAGGALALAELLRGEQLDFVMLLSSLSSVLVGLGFVPYAAANLVLDSLAERESSMGPTPWISVNWDGWDFSGEAKALGQMLIDPREGSEAFERILADAPLQAGYVVSTGDLDARIRQWIEMPSADAEAPRAETVESPRHERPDLSSAFVELRTETEQAIAQVWQQLLGVTRIGADDNFFELGGHSLLAIQLTARMRELFHVDVPVRVLFDAPTIAALAAFTDDAKARTDVEVAHIVRVLERVERLSDEEMRALIAQADSGLDGDHGHAAR